MANIMDLPAEILENIFSYLKVEEHLKCTEVCKKFNGFIGQNEQIMSRIVVRWNDHERDPMPLQLTSRLYQNIMCIKSKHFAFLINFLESQPKIAFVQIGSDNDYTFSTFRVWTIIELVKNSLQKLNLFYTKFNDIDVFLPIYVPNLRSLDFGYNNATEKEKVLGLLYCTEELKELTIGSHPSTEIEFVKKVETFLVRCAGLKKLYLEGDSIVGSIFNYAPDFAERVKFELEELILNPIFSKSDQFTYFATFIEKQRCLNTLILSGMAFTEEMLNAILGLKKLEYVDLDEFILDNVRNLEVRSSSIEILKLYVYMNYDPEDLEWLTGVCEIIKGCPAVKKLILHGRLIGFMKEIADDLLKLNALKELYIDMSFEIHPFNLPTLRALCVDIETFDCTDAKAKKLLEFVTLNPQLTRIRIRKTFEGHKSLKDLEIHAGDKLEYYT